MDPLTIVFALVAVLAIWKLNAVLGQDVGFRGPRSKSRPPIEPANAPDPKAPDAGGPAHDNVVRLPGPGAPARPRPERWTASLDPTAEPGTAGGLEAIAAADPRFSAEPFLDGALTAYEAIVAAFATGERRMLQSLLAPDVLADFDSAIREREARKETLSTTFVSVDGAKIVAATLEGRQARVVVRFVSKQISATHDAAGALVAGSPDTIADVVDVWTFARDTGSRDPNWTLVATRSDA